MDSTYGRRLVTGLAGIVLILVLSLALAACGGSSGATTSSVQGTTSSAGAVAGRRWT